MTKFHTAVSDTISIHLMDNLYPDMLKVNNRDDITRWWEVIDRTTGEVVSPADWTYDEESGNVTINNATPFHEYSGKSQRITGLRLRLPGAFRRRGFQPDLLMPQGALLRRGRSDSFTSAKPEEDAVGNQCRIRQKGGIVSWRYFTLQ